MKCCHHCVPPKRHTACWGTCPDYIQEKAEEEAKKEAERKRRQIDFGIGDQRGRGVRKALKRRKTYK
jgi:hypothetical protein